MTDYAARLQVRCQRSRSSSRIPAMRRGHGSANERDAVGAPTIPHATNTHKQERREILLKCRQRVEYAPRPLRKGLLQRNSIVAAVWHARRVKESRASGGVVGRRRDAHELAPRESTSRSDGALQQWRVSGVAAVSVRAYHAGDAPGQLQVSGRTRP